MINAGLQRNLFVLANQRFAYVITVSQRPFTSVVIGALQPTGFLHECTALLCTVAMTHNDFFLSRGNKLRVHILTIG